MAEQAVPELDVEGPGAPPRRNGELVFEAPWQSRVFGLALALHERGLFAWDEFRAHLIAEIGAWDRAHPDAQGFAYWSRWLAALESLLQSRDVCRAHDVSRRAEGLAARSPGHDH
jgi:nitrile hydratase accessory protein